MIPRAPGATYEDLRRQFDWELPPRFNMGLACADQQSSDAPALIEIRPDGDRAEYSFGELANLSSRLANGLRSLGIEVGDRVGVVLPQRVETGLAHLAVWKLGAISVPMPVLFGPLALTYRLGDSAAKAVVTDREHLEAVAGVAAELGGITVIVVDDAIHPHEAFWDLIADGAPTLRPVPTTPDTPGLLIYTSGTTGPPKGALHGHRVLLGHLPGFELSHNFFPQDDDRFWTPADWAWIGGLMDALMPSWFHGRPVIAAGRGRFDPEWALRLMTDTEVRNVFFPPTVLKLMRQAKSGPAEVSLRSMMCGGEPLGEEILTWARETLDVTINEIYGQTEVNYVVGNCHEAWAVRPGSMGRPYPGHDVAVIGADGRPLPAGDAGELAVATPDPVAFLEYWGQPDATRAKFTDDGRWLRTGDLGRADEDGYLWFESRSDDVISSAGYRIGPAEIEECLLHHPAVALCAAVGVPDEVRGQVVKAFIQLAEGHAPSPRLEDEIQQLVRTRLAAYEYPRAFEFVEQLPMTATGKIRRAELGRREQEGDRVA
jgi:acetyl-CoA synthetase